MIEDDVLREIRTAREAFARLHNYDIHAMAAAIRERDKTRGWPVVRRAPRPAVFPKKTPKSGAA